MGKWFSRIEKVILILTITCLTLLIGVQYFFVNDNSVINTNYIPKNDKYIPLNKQKEDKGVLIIKLLDDDCDEINILVNGEQYGNFKKDKEIMIKVYENDLIEVDGTEYLNNVNVKIQGISKNIQSPKLDTKVTTSKSIEILGRVRLK